MSSEFANTDTMASISPDAELDEQVPLFTLYLQIENATISSEVLGLAVDTTEGKIRDAYRAVARRIHPDKAPSDSLRELHTSLFQKVQDASEQLLRDVLATNHKRNETLATKSRRLLETAESLHARNIAFREALKQEREKALSAKCAAYAAREARKAMLTAKDERLKEKREEYSARLKSKKQLRDADDVSTDEPRGKRRPIKHGRKKFGARKGRPMREDEALEIESFKHDTGDRGTGEDLSWEEEEVIYQAYVEAGRIEDKKMAKEDKAARKAKRKEYLDAVQAAHDRGEEYRPSNVRKDAPPPWRKPTSDTARPKWDQAVDERLVSKVEIKARWDKALSSGRGMGSVSLGQKKQRENGSAAKSQKYTLALAEEADASSRAALRAKATNKTFSGMVQNELVAEAFVGAEARSDVRTSKALGRLMNPDVTDMYLLEESSIEELRRPMELLEFVVR